MPKCEVIFARALNAIAAFCAIFSIHSGNARHLSWTNTVTLNILMYNYLKILCNGFKGSWFRGLWSNCDPGTGGEQ